MAERREELRAADVDREFVADRLKAALNEGRLTLTEYDERLRDAYSAKTYGDLDQVLVDLPGPRSPERSQVAPASAYATAGRPPARDAERAVPIWLSRVWGAWAVAVSVNVVIWLLVSLSNGDPAYFWPMWVAGPWGAVLFAITISGLASGAPYRPAGPGKRHHIHRNPHS